MSVALRILAIVALVLVGLVTIRWMTSATGAAATNPGGRIAPPPARFGLGAPTAEPELDPLILAHAEAMRLAEEELAADRLQSARDLYFLAVQARPDDAEAADRLRQVDAALAIDRRRGDWMEALADLDELWSVAPRSPTVFRAYVTSLAEAGREALAQGSPGQAIELCAEALRWAPSRDAQACMAEAQRRLGISTPTPAGSPTVPRLPAPGQP